MLDKYRHLAVKKYLDEQSPDRSRLPDEFLTNPNLYPGRCPKCNGIGVWRWGVYYDDMKRCPECNILWSPEAVFDLQQFVNNELTLNNGGGI